MDEGVGAKINNFEKLNMLLSRLSIAFIKRFYHCYLSCGQGHFDNVAHP